MSKIPFRWDQVGSLLRPQALKEAREKFKNGEISKADLTKVEDEEIIKVIEKQNILRLVGKIFDGISYPLFSICRV